MLKTILLTSLISTTTVVVLAGRTTYSALQIQTPFGSAFKMTPDPANIWSFNETYAITKTGKHSIPVLVDFEGDGKMDTNHTGVRVMVTDMSIRRSSVKINEANDLRNLHIVDSKGIRWCPSFTGYGDRGTMRILYGDHLSTPLVLPINSDLRVEFETNYMRSPIHDEVQIHLIGRVVTL